MTRHLPIYILFPLMAAVLWLTASCTAESNDTAAGGRLTLVLNISDSPAISRADDTPDTEKIHTLRIIVTRPDGSVEANRLISGTGSGVRPDDLCFDIAADRWKTVYLIANESSAGIDPGALLKVSPGALDDPSAFPDDIVSALVGDVPEGAPLPMTSVYRLSTASSLGRPDGNGRLVVEYNLHLMRTMSKFTFNITNRRQIPVNISSLGISGIQVSDHWLFPHVGTAALSESVHYLTAEGADVTESGTGLPPGGPAATPDTDWYTYRYLASATGHGSRTFIEGPLSLPAGSSQAFEFYNPECAVPAGADPSAPYILTVQFDGNTYTCPLHNMPSLPRNTHVVVNLTFSNNDKILDVEVLPYYGVSLSPGFGQ